MTDEAIAQMTDDELIHARNEAEDLFRKASGEVTTLFLASRRTADGYRLTRSMIGKRGFYIDMSSPLIPTVVEGVIELGHHSWEDDCYPDIFFAEHNVYMDVDAVYVSQEGVERDLASVLAALRNAAQAVASQLDNLRIQRRS